MNKITNYEGNMQKLTEILDKLSADDITLDETISLYSEAADIIAETNGILEDAQLKIDEISAKMPLSEAEQ